MDEHKIREYVRISEDEKRRIARRQGLSQKQKAVEDAGTIVVGAALVGWIMLAMMALAEEGSPLHLSWKAVAPIIALYNLGRFQPSRATILISSITHTFLITFTSYKFVYALELSPIIFIVALIVALLTGYLRYSYWGM